MDCMRRKRSTTRLGTGKGKAELRVGGAEKRAMLEGLDQSAGAAKARCRATKRNLSGKNRCRLRRAWAVLLNCKAGLWPCSATP